MIVQSEVVSQAVEGFMVIIERLQTENKRLGDALADEIQQCGGDAMVYEGQIETLDAEVTRLRAALALCEALPQQVETTREG